MALIVVALLVLSLANLCRGVAIDNGIVDTPTINCMEDRILFTFKTERPFNGRIYVRGRADDETCMKNFASSSVIESFGEWSVPLGGCGMRRERQLNPPSMNMALTIVVSFHPMFVTKVDKAYRLECTFRSAPIMVTEHLDVSMIPTTPLTGGGPQATCTYEIRRDSPDGPSMRYAKIGEKSYHVWECTASTDSIYRILVHECIVSDEASSKMVMVVDPKGCVMDNVLMGDVKYDVNKPLAYAETHVYKYSDQSAIYFMCNIRICNPMNEDCNNFTPPNCDNSSRASRRLSQTLSPFPAPFALRRREPRDVSEMLLDEADNELTVNSPDIVVLDLGTSTMDVNELNRTLHIPESSQTSPITVESPADPSRFSNFEDFYNEALRIWSERDEFNLFAMNAAHQQSASDNSVLATHYSSGTAPTQLHCLSPFMYGLTITATILSLFICSAGLVLFLVNLIVKLCPYEFEVKNENGGVPGGSGGSANQSLKFWQYAWPPNYGRWNVNWSPWSNSPAQTVISSYGSGNAAQAKPYFRHL